MPVISLLCVFFSFIVAFFGRERKMGFWGYFFSSLFLTPFVGILLVLVSDKSKDHPDERED